MQADYFGRLESLPYEAQRDEVTCLLNPVSIREYSLRLAAVVGDVLDAEQFSLVLGGDCSILLANALALRRRGRYGLVFIDGHQDFYRPEASPTGEVPDVDFRLVSGRGPDVLSNIENRAPLIRDEDIVVFGFRDTEEMETYQEESVRDTAMHSFGLDDVRRLGARTAAVRALDVVASAELEGFWVHLDDEFLDLRSDLKAFIEPRLDTLDRSFVPVLGHIDYKPWNVMIRPESGETTAVLDWGHATAMAPYYDLILTEEHLSRWAPLDSDRREHVRTTLAEAYAETNSLEHDSQFEERRKLYLAVARLQPLVWFSKWTEDLPDDERRWVAAKHREFVEDLLW